MPWWLAVVAVLAWILAGAKAHGRQVRLEREQQGVFSVDFRGQNPASVERIWRQDRRIFWPLMALLSVLLLGIAVLGDGGTLRIALALPLAFAASFTLSGLASWIRLTRLKQGPGPWRSRAQRGSLLWWLLVAATAALTLVALGI